MHSCAVIQLCMCCCGQLIILLQLTTDFRVSSMGIILQHNPTQEDSINIGRGILSSPEKAYGIIRTMYNLGSQGTNLVP